MDVARNEISLVASAPLASNCNSAVRRRLCLEQKISPPEYLILNFMYPHLAKKLSLLLYSRQPRIFHQIFKKERRSYPVYLKSRNSYRLQKLICGVTGTFEIVENRALDRTP